MTVKELAEVKRCYKARIQKIQEEGENLMTYSYGFAAQLSTEMCYNHHKRGQRLWAFFQALQEVEGV